jgi:MFS transporter, SP family, general alpha glucoside:H+ symporter
MLIVMEAYDTLLLGSLFGLPSFRTQFGFDAGGTAGYQISASWQAATQQVRPSYQSGLISREATSV